MPASSYNSGIKLKHAFREERKRERQSQRLGWQSLYFQPFIAQQLFELHCQNGTFNYRHAKDKELNGRYLYVRALDGRILAAKEGEVGHHSYLSNGKKVLSAGHLVFNQGQLILFSNESGHYTPTNDEMAPEIIFFHNLAQNPALVYEDHSHYPQSRKITQYKTQSIIAMGGIDITPPYEILSNRTSNVGRQLTLPAAHDKHAGNTPESRQKPNYQEEQLFLSWDNATEPALNHYLEDECLMRSVSYEDSASLLGNMAASPSQRGNSYKFFMHQRYFADETDTFANNKTPDTPK